MKPIYLSGVLFFTLLACNQPAEKETKTPEKVEQSPAPAEHFVMPEIPDHVTFCEQPFDLTHFDAKERLDRELLANTFFHSNTFQYFKRANRYFGTIERILAEENVPEDLKYLCLIESGLTQAVSPAGAKGFWQFMPAAGKEYGLTINGEIDERYNVEKSTRAACAYLKDAYAKFDDWALTAAAYNRGVGGIQGDLENQDVEEYMDLHLNHETSRYLFRMLAMKLIFEKPGDYGFHPDEMYLYEPYKTRKIRVTESIADLIAWSKENGSNYHELKVLNPWILGTTLTVRNQPYTIELPA